MNLIFIYGPPASGKTTIGRELAARTGYRFFYNHLTVPAAKAIFPDAHGPIYDERYTQLLQTLRINALTTAAEAHFDVIFTLAYSGTVDDAFVSTIVEVFTSCGGNVHFVELHAPPETLTARVGNPDRNALGMGKMTDPTHLDHVLNGRDMFASMPYDPLLKIDTSITPVGPAVQQIISYCRI